jgi:hypothetical protein
MEFSSRESVYAKEAVAMIGNIESSVIFDSIVNVGKNAQPSAGRSQTQTDRADMSKTKEMELGGIQNPLKEDA